MGSVWIKEFTGGLDLRKLAETSPGGTLIRARDCHITRGGEIEQRADFVSVYALPPGLTKGLYYTPTGLVVFGHQSTPAGIPAGVTYQRLQHPNGEALVRVRYATLFRGRIQAVGEFSDGSAHVFYDGNRVTDTNAPPNAAGSQAPSVLLTQSSKMYIGAGPDLFFSQALNSTNYDSAAVGSLAGVIVMSTHAEGAETITALGRYDEYTAVFSRRVVQIWFFDPDPELNRQAQVLLNTGTIAPKSVTQFGDGDLFYLDISGIRSLRARNSSNSASTTDIGSPIDTLVAADVLNDPLAPTAIGLIEPRDGRFWMIVGDTIYVFSYFSASKVSAWSVSRPGFTVEDGVVFQDRVWLRSGDTIYVYGSQTGPYQFSESVQPEAWMPYLDAGAPARAKLLMGVDAAVRGTWEIRVATDPTDVNVSDVLARVDRTTFGLERLPVVGNANHFSLRFRGLRPASATEPALVSSAVLHFERDAEEDS